MEPQLAELIHAYRTRVMMLNSVSPEVVGRFNVQPSVEQTLEDKVREQSDFLQRINTIGVRDLVGQKVNLDVTGPIASRTNTDTSDRQTSDTHALGEDEYRCEKTDFDTHVKYNTLDTWSRFPDFQARITNAVTRQIARDRLTIGFNGTSAAADTDSQANPLLQDVNIGWLEHMRTHKSESVLNGLKIGVSGDAQTSAHDFATLDAAIYAARHELIAPWHANSTDLVAIMGSALVVDKNTAALDTHDAPTERAALQTLLINGLIGTLPPMIVPFFPADAIFITSLDNLSVYYQRGSRRRTIVDNAKRDRLEDYQSVNEAYVVEDYDKGALLTGIRQPDGAGGWQ
ncbi:MAG: phage major capsid protein, P2 family [Litorimonas sp.]